MADRIALWISGLVLLAFVVAGLATLQGCETHCVRRDGPRPAAPSWPTRPAEWYGCQSPGGQVLHCHESVSASDCGCAPAPPAQGGPEVRQDSAAGERR